MATKPTESPEWALNDKIDVVSGQNNVASPSASEKSDGYNYLEYPKRQNWNWLGRMLSKWVEWLTQETENNTTSINANTLNIAINASNINTLNSQMTELQGVKLSNAYYRRDGELRRFNSKNISTNAGEIVMTIPATGKQLFVNLSNSFEKEIINGAGDNWEDFVAGDNNGGVPTAISDPVANSFYYIFAVKDETNIVEYILDSSGFASNALDAYNTAYSSGGVANVAHRYLGMVQILDPLENGIYEIKDFNMVGNNVFWKDTYTTTIQTIDTGEPTGEQHDFDKDLASKPTFGRSSPSYLIGNVRLFASLTFTMLDSGGTGADVLVYKFLTSLWRNPARYVVSKDSGTDEKVTRCIVNDIFYVGENKVKMSTSNPGTTDMSVNSHALGYVDPLRERL